MRRWSLSPDMEVGQHKMKWTLYLGLASMFIFVSVTEVGPFSSLRRALYAAEPTPPPLHRYVIVFDGGSTGTRIHVFTFTSNAESGRVILKDSYFEEVKPGLSNYANSPNYAANSILGLLEKAKEIVPSHHWVETPVALRATAGLRLLPGTMSDSILNAISEALENSPFLTREKSVGILDGEDEGLYAWYTLNFLLGKLSEASRSAVALDLGGGSTQVTFTPVELETFIQTPKEYVVVKKVHNKTLPIYTHSYLGLGLMAARVALLTLSSENAAALKSDNTKFRSSCIHPHTKFVWKYDSKEYTIRGRKDEKYGYEECYAKAAEFLGNFVDSPEELQRREIYALSYYVDRAMDLGIIGEEGGVKSVRDFVSACRSECSAPRPTQPLLCLDCTYLCALLRHGLGLPEEKELRLVKRINGIEASWGLGAAFSML